ncbi:MAG: hypothetical protein KF833_06605 [Verrucomicrobiae bacterium]|nr:hypothetical protein [Verrucomicrobiae bacterium]
MIAQRTDAAAPRGVDPAAGPLPGTFPSNLTEWAGTRGLLRAVEDATAHAGGDSWLNLVRDHPSPTTRQDLMVVVAYCYLQGIYHSMDVVRCLESDELLHPWRGRLNVRPEQIRRFRRDHRRALADCLTRSLLNLWRHCQPTSWGAASAALSNHLLENRMRFTLLEPFYLEAQDRLDRAVILDSMALDY